MVLLVQCQFLTQGMEEMKIDLNTPEGKLLIILLVFLAIYHGIKAWAGREARKLEQKKKEPKKTVIQGDVSTPVWTRDTRKQWTTSGWYYDETKEKWIPPDYTNSKANTNVPKFRTQEELKRAKQIRLVRSGPTFEEWKAMQEQKKTEH